VTATLYRALFCDLLTDRAITTLPLSQAQYADYIGKSGTLSATVPVTTPEMASAALRVVPGRTSVYLMRAGIVWWGGIIWTAVPQSDARGNLSMSLAGATFDTYAAHRRIRSDLSWTQTDQLDIARGLVDHMQGAQWGDIGLTYDTNTSGVLRDQSYTGTDEGLYSDALTNLGALENGFEQYVRVYLDAEGNRVRELDLGYPALTSGASPIMLSKPGRIGAYQFPDDASSLATTWVSRGATDNTDVSANSAPMVTAEVQASAMLLSGWPRLDGSSDYSTVTDPETLLEHANADLAAAENASQIPTVTAVLDEPVTPAVMGAQLRTRIRDAFYPTGRDDLWRITGYQVTPPARGQAETVTYTLEAVS
jgi:hypothetical protein